VAASISGAEMIKCIVAGVFFLVASVAVYGATVAPAAMPFDGYDHSFETMHADLGDPSTERGY
jgi:hypothetical protein